MPGLLDVFNTPEGMQGLALLGAAAPSMEPQNLAGRFAMAGNAYRGMQRGLLQDKFIQSQIDENSSQAAERKALADAKAAELARQLRIQQSLPSLYGGGFTGGQAQPQSLGGQPMWSQPVGAAPMQSTPSAFNWQAAVAMGMKPDEAEKYAKLAELGRAEVARTIEEDDGKGGKQMVQFDKFGNRVGAGVTGYIAPVQVDTGKGVQFVKPQAGLSLAKQPTYGDDISAGNLGVARDRLAFDRAGGAAPAGYRRAADGSSLEFVPGGPADPAAAKRAAPTEFQGKSTTFAARMQDAAKVIDEFDGKVSPTNVARSSYRPEFPNWLPGGQIAGATIGALNKYTVPDDAQKYAQAQENWVTANLRQESGAAIGKDEMAKDIAKWFPQPNDPKAIIEQKAAARKVAERAMVVQAGPGASAIPGIVGDAPLSTSAATPGAVHWRYENGKLVKVQ